MKPAHVINVEESRKAEVGGQRSDVRNWKAESGNRKGAGSRAASRSTLDPGHSTLFFLFALLLLVPIASGLPPKPAKSPAKAANAQPVPVARWTFDNEVGGEFPATGSGSGIPLKKSGGIEVVAGRSSNALQFGATGVAEIEQSMGDLVSNQFTVMLWILKTKEVMNSDGYASLFDAGGRDGVGIRIKQHKTITVSTSGVNNYLWNAKRLPEGEWVQIACTFDGDKTIIYENGEAGESPDAGSNKPQIFGSKMTVGSTAFNGAIDDLRIYDTALTPEQITAAEND